MHPHFNLSPSCESILKVVLTFGWRDFFRKKCLDPPSLVSLSSRTTHFLFMILVITCSGRLEIYQQGLLVSSFHMFSFYFWEISPNRLRALKPKEYSASKLWLFKFYWPLTWATLLFCFLKLKFLISNVFLLICNTFETFCWLFCTKNILKYLNCPF